MSSLRVRFIAQDIVEYYEKAEADRGEEFPETFVCPLTKKEVPNAVTIPVSLLNQLRVALET